MSDFEAKIKALLDLSEVDKQIDSIGKKKKVTLDVDTKNAEKEVKKSLTHVGEEFKKSINFGAAALLAAKSFNLIANSARKAVKSTREIDKAITDLRMATGESYDNVSKMVRGYNQLGQEIGATTLEITSGADAWLRQGHNISDTNTLIKDSMILSKVAGLSAEDATKYLTSAMKGYKMTAGEVIGIADKLTAIDLVSAVDAGGLAEAMSRTAVTAQTAGISMDKLLGYLAATGEVTQRNMSTVGESFKTIFTRMSSIKNVEEVLDSAGIKLKKSEDEYRNFGEVLDEVGQRWKTFSSVQKAEVSTAFAGVRQSENFKVLMENYDLAMKYMDAAAESTGTAESKYQAYLDSVEAKTKSLQAALESLGTTTITGEALGGIIDATSALVVFLDKTQVLKGALAGSIFGGAVKGFSMMAAGINKAALTMHQFNTALQLVKAGDIGKKQISELAKLTENLSKSQMKAVLASENLTGKQRVAILTAQGMSKAEAEAALSAMGLAGAQTTAGAATRTLSSSLKGLWATLMANPLMLVAAGITAVVSVFSAVKRNVEEARQTSLDAASAARDEANNIAGLYSTYKKTQKAYADGSASKEEFTSATDDLLASIGVEKAELDGLIAKYGDLDTAINATTKSRLQHNLAEMTSGYSAASGNLLDATRGHLFGGAFNSISYTDRVMEGNKDKIAEILNKAGAKTVEEFDVALGYMTTHVDFGGNTKSVDGVIEMYNNMVAARDALEAEVGNLYTREELASSDVYQSINNKIGSFSEEYKVALDAITDINKTAAKLEIMDQLESGTMPKTREEFDQMVDSMVEAAQKSGNFVGSAEQIRAGFITAFSETPEYSEMLGQYADQVQETGEVVTETIETVKEKAKSFVSGISEIQGVLASQSGGKSISIDDLSAEGMKDYLSALEYTNGAMQLNAEKVQQIIEAKTEEQIATNNANKALEQTKYIENARQIEQYRKQLRDKNYESEAEAAQIGANIDMLLSQNSTIASTCSQYDALSAAMREASGAYQHWLNAQSAGDYGDMANDSLGAIDRIMQTYNKDSDIFGDFGSKKFDAAVDFIIPKSVDGEDAEAIYAYMDSFSEYLTFDKGGKATGLNVDQFLKASVDAGLMSYSEDDGFQILGNKKMEDFANGLDMSSGMVQAFFDELQLKGADFDWGDEAVQTFGDLAIKANESAEALRTISDEPIKIDFSDITGSTEVERVQNQIKEIDKTIEQMNRTKMELGVDSSEAEYANDIIQYCVKQKQLLTVPDIVRVDTSQVAGDMATAIGLVQEFHAAVNEQQILAAVGADTSEADSKINELLGKMRSSEDVTVTLGIDTTSADAAMQSISSLKANDLVVKASVDPAAIIGYQPEEKHCDVVYDPQTAALPNSFDDITRNVNYKARTGSLPSSFSTITRYVRYVTVGTKVKGGHGDVSGTAHINGTARAGGDWGTAPGGKTLVGELGREIVVDPHTGRWYTVGDTGAEFRNIPEGAIVFNHIQSQSLLENGYVSGRAHALVSGTALVRGGYKPVDVGSIIGSHGGSSNRTPTYHEHTSSDWHKPDENTEQENRPGAFDWVEVLLDRAERVLDRLKTISSSAFKAIRTQAEASTAEIDKITEQLKLQSMAYDRYIEEANAVGLSPALAERVRNGAIDIHEYDDETQELITDYQEWYDKALDCKEAMDDLHESLAKVYEEDFERIQRDFENQIGLLEDLEQQYKNKADLIESKGYLGSSDYFTNMSDASEKKLTILNKELADLQASFKKAMDSGEIEQYSDAWYDFQSSINGVKNEIGKTEVEIQDLNNGLRNLEWEHFDYAQDRIAALNDEASFVISMMEDKGIFDEQGFLNDAGKAAMGLRGQNFNVHMAQARKYAKAAAAVNEQLYNDPSNTKLIERKEELLRLQRESIQAAHDERDAMVDMVRNGIEAQLTAIRELIDTYTDALDNAKSLHDYQNSISDKTEKIASLEKQLLAYGNDDSDEAKNKIQQLKGQLTKAQTDLRETEYDYFVQDQKKMLDELYNEYEVTINKRLDNVDSLISDLINGVNANSAEINQTIKDIAAENGFSISGDLAKIWEGNINYDGVLRDYNETYKGHLISVESQLDSIQSIVSAMGNQGLAYGYSSARSMPAVSHNLPQLDLASILRNVNTPNQDINTTVQNDFHINIDHVQDYNDFVNRLQHDKEFERMMQSMTVNRLAGKSSLDKYRHTW